MGDRQDLMMHCNFFGSPLCLCACLLVIQLCGYLIATAYIADHDRYFKHTSISVWSRPTEACMCSTWLCMCSCHILLTHCVLPLCSELTTVISSTQTPPSLRLKPAEGSMPISESRSVGRRPPLQISPVEESETGSSRSLPGLFKSSSTPLNYRIVSSFHPAWKVALQPILFITHKAALQ